MGLRVGVRKRSQCGRGISLGARAPDHDPAFIPTRSEHVEHLLPNSQSPMTDSDSAGSSFSYTNQPCVDAVSAPTDPVSISIQARRPPTPRRLCAPHRQRRAVTADSHPACPRPPHVHRSRSEGGTTGRARCCQPNLHSFPSLLIVNPTPFTRCLYSSCCRSSRLSALIGAINDAS